MAGNTPGPDSRGPRTQFTLRLPTGHLELYTNRARSEGVSVTDYLTRHLAQAHGLELPSYLNRVPGPQLDLDISA